MPIEIKKYNLAHKAEWDDFIRKSKNGTFLLLRDYMEYHKDRFIDSSLLFYKEGKLCALLPANIEEKNLFSHKGLTYGGLVFDTLITTKGVLDIFSSLRKWMKKMNVDHLYYKPTPHIYHQSPSEEDLYALFRNGARLITRNISSALNYSNIPNYSSQRKRGLSKARRENFSVEESADFGGFWHILSKNLNEKYNVAPTHSSDEIMYLETRFPQNIKLYTVFQKGSIASGCVLYITDTVAHIQYVAATDEGKRNGAIDLLVDYLINKYRDKSYFDYGISTEQNGLYLNEQLIHQKEGFGLRGIVYDTYLIES